jgi:hypothetical protein
MRHSDAMTANGVFHEGERDALGQFEIGMPEIAFAGVSDVGVQPGNDLADVGASASSTRRNQAAGAVEAQCDNGDDS